MRRFGETNTEAEERLQSDPRYQAAIDQQAFAIANLITIVYAVVLRLLCYGRWM